MGAGYCSLGVAVALVGAAVCARGGNLNSPAFPAAPGGAMYTLQDLYNRLDTGAAGAKRAGPFTEPAAGPTAGTMRTLDDIMAKMPATNADAAVAGDVMAGKTFWSLRAGAWGPRVGTLAAHTLSADSLEVAAGYYAATNLAQVNTNLAAGNIKAGVAIFGVAGGTNVVDTSSGNAVAGDMALGKKAWVGGMEVTGTVSLVSSPPKTGQTNVYTVYDDGWYSTNLGAAWPNPRFAVGTGAASNCITDNLTGLMWLKTPRNDDLPWVDAVTYCNDLDGTEGRGGHTDWRMPGIRELQGLIDVTRISPALPPDHPFAVATNSSYWSDATVSDNPGHAWSMQISVGRMTGTDKVLSGSTWPVRGSTGVRFGVGVDAASNCVSDYSSGLMWVRTPSAALFTWDEALTYCAGLDGVEGRGGYTDWRMPNWRELYSLIDGVQTNPALPAGHPFAVNPTGIYWSSTTVADDASQAWVLAIGVGRMDGASKALSPATIPVWPVRGGL